MKKQRYKDREGIVYSTDNTFNYQYQSEGQIDSLPPAHQNLKVALDKSGRAGKKVTLITGYIGQAEDLSALAKKLKTQCGTGGSSKDGEILIQGDVRDKVVQILQSQGYRVKRVG